MARTLAALTNPHAADAPRVYYIRARAPRRRAPQNVSYNPVMQEQPAVIWYEVENILRYFDHYVTPTGIERVCFEIFSALNQLSEEEGPVRFCRISMFTGRFEEVSFEQISEAYTSRRGADAPWSILPLSRRPWREWRTILGAAARFPRYALRTISHFLGDVVRSRTRGDEGRLAPGDVIFSVGSSWVVRNLRRHIIRLKRDRHVRYVQLVHDVIPILYPSWTPWFAPAFRRWVNDIASISDLLLTISKCSGADLEAYAAGEGFALPPVRSIRLGTGFPAGFRLSPRGGSPVPGGAAQLLPARFVLCVSTLETRKNHPLLLKVWRNLMATHGPDKVPHLVLVGRVSYFVLDTQPLRARLLDKSLHGRVIAVGHLRDADLAEAYRRCLFTVFPSLYEGWGLPVEESFTYGKFCVTSNSSSMPEVGGDLADYFAPADAEEAQRALERALFEPAYVAAREERIRTHYRPHSWRDCALDSIQHAQSLAEATVTR